MVEDQLLNFRPIYEVKMIATGGKHRVIYHAHTTNIIALTFVLPLEDKVFTREL